MDPVQSAAQWLNRNHIVVPDDWLQACVEWISEENQISNLSMDALSTHVYEQWLLSDLHELETSCLPPDVVTAQKFTLSGTFALQVDSILDVGVSFYSQSQKIQGKENANVHVSADEPAQKPWEQKPSRMLMMNLTDGTHNLQAMEYRSISSLNPQTPPGAKVLVHGSVLCRRGILMLAEANIKALGGEVDTLVEANTMINTLQSALETSAQNANKHHKQTYPGSVIRRIKSDDKSTIKKEPHTFGARNQSMDRGGGYNQNQSIKSEFTGNQSVKREFTGNQSSTRGFSGNQSNNRGTGNLSRGKIKTEVFSQPQQVDFDDFMDEADDDLFRDLDTGAESVSSYHSNLPGHSNHSTSRNTANKNNNSKTKTIQQTQVKQEHPTMSRSNTGWNYDDDLDAMDFEDDMDFPPMDEGKPMIANQCVSNNSIRNPLTNRNTVHTRDVKPMTNRNAVNNSAVTNNPHRRDSFESKQQKPFCAAVPPNQCGQSSSKANTNQVQSINFQATQKTMLKFPDNTFKHPVVNDFIKNAVVENMDVTINMTSNEVTSMHMVPLNVTNGNNSGVGRVTSGIPNQSNVTNMSMSDMINRAQTNVANCRTQSTTPQSQTSTTTCVSNVKPEASGSTKHHNPCGEGNKFNNSAQLGEPCNKSMKFGETSAASVKSTAAESESSTKLRKLKKAQSEFVKNTPAPDFKMEYPYTYLSRVMKEPPTAEPAYHTVKAYIATLVGKISANQDKWSLTVKINDGSMAVDVDLSNQVLTEMVGFSAAEANEMKLRVRTDPKVKEVLLEGIQQCQQKLIELMCLLELEININHPRPVIVAKQPLTSYHIDMLHNRVMAATDR